MTNLCPHNNEKGECAECWKPDEGKKPDHEFVGGSVTDLCMECDEPKEVHEVKPCTHDTNMCICSFNKPKPSEVCGVAMPSTLTDDAQTFILCQNPKPCPVHEVRPVECMCRARSFGWPGHEDGCPALQSPPKPPVQPLEELREQVGMILKRIINDANEVDRILARLNSIT